MTNETTASQPTPHQNTLDAITGAIAYGRQGTNPPPSPDHWLAEYWSIGQQLAELGKTSAWDNVTPTGNQPMQEMVRDLYNFEGGRHFALRLEKMLASQPKSIGDDAQCGPLQYLHNVCADVVPALLNCGRQRLADLLEGALRGLPVAPVAQASATIQAASDVGALTEQSEAWLAVCDALTEAAPGWQSVANTGMASAVETIRCLSATIQEPVMVAEPVGLKLAAYRVTSPNTGKERLMKKSMAKVWDRSGYVVTPLYEVTTQAAPMVADPAGVAGPGEIDLIALLENCKPNYDDAGSRNIDVTSKRIAIDEAIRRLRIAGPQFTAAKYLAATVKAVPSAALAAIHGLIAVAGAAYHLMDNTEESGPVGASVFKHQEDDNAYLNEALDQLDALPDDQPGYVMGPCAKAEWALRHILAAPLADKTGGRE